MIRLKVKEIAQGKGMSQKRLSKLSEVDINAVRRIFRNPYASVRTETLDKLAKALQVDASLLIESVPDE